MRISSILALLICVPSFVFGLDIENTMNGFHDAEVACVDFKFCDIHGNLKLVTVPLSFVKNALTRGLNFDGSSVPGCTNINNSDLLLMPDLNTVHIYPWLDSYQDRTAGIFCDICLDKNTPYSSPRTILKSVLDQALAMGFEFYVGPELEFFFMNTLSAPCDQKKYFDGTNDVHRMLMQRELLNALHKQGVKAEKLHHEVANGQHEISIKYGNALAIADQIIIAKDTIRTVAERYNLKATFMPKPIYGQNGSAMHIHFSLWDVKQKNNAFYDAKHPDQLSKTAQQFLAGILRHVKELNLIFNPNVNSYKRLVPGYEAPIYICWGNKNRSAMIRIPEVGNDEPYAVRAEIRSPDPSCNPYLAFAALLKAGLEGIKHNYKLPAAAKENVYHLNAADLKSAQIESLPTSLGQAIELFSTSKLAQDLLGTTLYNELIKIKTKELHSFSTTVTDWETEKYF